MCLLFAGCVAVTHRYYCTLQLLGPGVLRRGPPALGAFPSCDSSRMRPTGHSTSQLRYKSEEKKEQ